MAPREDLINSAVSFLQDPSVATAPIDKRRAFLSSKNLTEEEIQLALARAGSDPSLPTASQSAPNYPYPPQQQQIPPPGYNYNNNYSYGPYPPWPNPPPAPPRRDWRDWFIMATVTAGVGYGVYTAAKLETDKSAIDAQFTKAFSLLDQLSTDTAVLRDSESQRTEKLDSSLADLETTIADLKENNKRREDEARRIGDEVRGLREIIPKALDGWKAEGDGRLKELGGELRSLRVLLGNRVGSSSTAGNYAQGQNGVAARGGGSGSGSGSGGGSGTLSSSFASEGANTGVQQEEGASTTTMAPAPAPGVTAPKREATGSPFSFEGRPAQRAIPAWQLAAAGKSKSSGTGVNGESGASTPAEGEREGGVAAGS